MFERGKPYLIAVLLLAWGWAFFGSLLKNPSVSEIKAQEIMIKNDLQLLLSHGGHVLSSTANAKYGSAYVAYNISVEGWSEALMQKYDATLISLNWVRLPNQHYRYCKDGVLGKLEANAGTLDKQSFNRIAFEFNAGTLKVCKTISPAA